MKPPILIFHNWRLLLNTICHNFSKFLVGWLLITTPGPWLGRLGLQATPVLKGRLAATDARWNVSWMRPLKLYIHMYHYVPIIDVYTYIYIYKYRFRSKYYYILYTYLNIYMVCICMYTWSCGSLTWIKMGLKQQ